MCKGANAAGPRAKVQRWMQSFQVAGGGPGWQARPEAARGYAGMVDCCEAET